MVQIYIFHQMRDWQPCSWYEEVRFYCCLVSLWLPSLQSSELSLCLHLFAIFVCIFESMNLLGHGNFFVLKISNSMNHARLDILSTKKFKVYKIKCDDAFSNKTCTFCSLNFERCLSNQCSPVTKSSVLHSDVTEIFDNIIVE